MPDSFMISYTTDCLGPLSVGFPRQEYWSGHFLLQGIFPTQVRNLCLLHWQADSLPLSDQGNLIQTWNITEVALHTNEGSKEYSINTETIRKEWNRILCVLLHIQKSTWDPKIQDWILEENKWGYHYALGMEKILSKIKNELTFEDEIDKFDKFDYTNTKNFSSSKKS